MDSPGPRIFEALTGVRPASAACWQGYRSHLARRNVFIHRGIEITGEEARESTTPVAWQWWSLSRALKAHKARLLGEAFALSSQSALPPRGEAQ
jgi:hypothetical protein